MTLEWQDIIPGATKTAPPARHSTMSGFEHYADELAQLDREILVYAGLCHVDLANQGELRRCLAEVHDHWPEDKARQSLRGLLQLRMKLETEMLEQGFDVPPVGGAADGGNGGNGSSAPLT